MQKKSICPWTWKNFWNEFFHSAPRLRIFLIKIISHYAPGLRKKLNHNFFHYARGLVCFLKNLFTMLLDLKFILVQKYLHHASGLGKNFYFNLFPGLGKFFRSVVSSLCPWTWKIFWKYFFPAMLLDLEFFCATNFHHV